MRRRHFVGASLAFLPAHAMASERTIGWVAPTTRENVAPFLAALKAGLAATRTARDLQILERYTTGGTQALAAAAIELQQQGVSLIVSQGAAGAVIGRMDLKVPVVFGFSGDPVVAGMARSLAKPGGNATGMTFMSVELNVKRIDLLRLALPQRRKMALVSNTGHAGEENEIVACQQAVSPTGIELAVYRFTGDGELRSTVARALDDGAQAIVVLPSATVVRQSAAAAEQCIARNVPLVSGWASIARAGALFTYGPNLEESFKRIALYVERVLAGAKPADLPIEQPSRFELVVNARTAARIGVALPPSLMIQAEEIIE